MNTTETAPAPMNDDANDDNADRNVESQTLRGQQTLKVTTAIRCDKFVSEALGISRADAQEAIAANWIRVNTKRTAASKGLMLVPGDTVVVAIEEKWFHKAALPDAASAARVSVIATTTDLVVLSKPGDMPSVALTGGEVGCVANALAHLHPECANASEDVREAGLVHRLDTGTTGVIVAARSRAAWGLAREEFRKHRVVKMYDALVANTLISDQVTIAQPLSIKGNQSKVDPAGHYAETDVTVVARGKEFSWVRCKTQFGRLHQVRAHLASINAPIVGDLQYGGPVWDLAGFALHASSMVLLGQTWEAPLPAERLAYFKKHTS